MTRQFRHIILFNLFLIAGMMISCNEEEQDIVPKYKESRVSFGIGNSIQVKSNTCIEQRTSRVKSSKVSNVLRGNAPMHIDGVRINAIHQSLRDSRNNPLSSEVVFEYAEEGEIGTEQVSMSIPCGENEFIANSISNAVAKNKVYKAKLDRFYSDIWWDASEEELQQEKIDYYSKFLEDIHPIYTEYTGSVIANVAGENPIVDIPMSTKGARFSIVLETTWDYYVSVTASYKVKGSSRKLTINKAAPQTVSAIVINEKDLTGGTQISIKVQVYEKRGRRYKRVRKFNLYKNGRTKYSTATGVNKTLIINYDPY